MDSSYSYTANSTISTISASYTSTQFSSQYPQEVIQINKPPPPFRPATHYSVRKFPAAKKTITKKLPIAPLPPIKRQKIYKVEPADFKGVVQKLTGAGELLHAPTRLQEVALPTLSLPPPPGSQPTVEKPLSEYFLMTTEYENVKAEKLLIGSNFGGVSSPIGYSSSTSTSIAWCSSMLANSGSLAGLELN